MADNYLDSKQIQNRLGIGRAAFYSLVARHDLRAHKIGRRIRVSERELDNYLKRCELKQEASNV